MYPWYYIKMVMIMTLLTLSSLFPLMKHPLSMSLTLILQTASVALLSSIMINTSWFSYILIMTIISGMLVLFTYMSSVASNENFYSSMKMTINVTLLLFLSTLLSFIVDQLETKKSWPTMKERIMDPEYLLTLNKIFNMHNIMPTIMMVTYLFLSMIIISYIVTTYEGPLRKKN